MLAQDGSSLKGLVCRSLCFSGGLERHVGLWSDPSNEPPYRTLLIKVTMKRFLPGAHSIRIPISTLISGHQDMRLCFGGNATLGRIPILSDES